jgi:hypothetical protein
MAFYNNVKSDGWRLSRITSKGLAPANTFVVSRKLTVGLRLGARRACLRETRTRMLRQNGDVAGATRPEANGGSTTRAI